MRSGARRLRGETVSMTLEVPVANGEVAISRPAARSAGMKSYFTGRPCCRGHVARRAVVNGMCLACGKEIKAKFRSAHKATERAANNRWRAQNPEALKIIKRREYEKNKEKYAAAGKQQRRLNASAIAEYMKRWREENRGRKNALSAARRQRARQSALWGADGVRAIYAACALLRRATGWDLQVDHVIPLLGRNVSGLHVPANLQILPARMNQQKGARLVSDAPRPPLDPDEQTLTLIVRADGTGEYNGIPIHA